ncbi:MAG: hypothetical protein ACTSWG_02440 [Candidatus Helarchaeota archaeon]
MNIIKDPLLKSRFCRRCGNIFWFVCDKKRIIDVHYCQKCRVREPRFPFKYVERYRNVRNK